MEPTLESPLPTRGEILRSIGFFLLTFTSVFCVYGLSWSGGSLWSDPWVRWDSLAFAGSLMTILLAHEMGHYVVARLHGFALSLPVFIPFPLGFGTMGAIIRLKSPPRSRQALLEMGAAGPIAGAVVALACLAIFLPYTNQGPLPPPGQYLIFNDPLAVRLIGWLVLGEPPGRYAELHPGALAGWVGCLLTGINLLPIGQLDGGHILNAVWPRAAKPLSWALLGALLVGGWFWQGWLVWAAALFLLGARHSMPVPSRPPLPARSLAVAGVAWGLFALTFMPVPVEVEGQQPAVSAGPSEG